VNLCRPCGHDFSSVEAFDRHRVGVHDYTYAEGLKFDPPVEDGRRCLRVDEILALGWEQNDQGQWFDPKRAARAKRIAAGRQNETPKPTEASERAA
jgi:hypothetical protein